MSVQLIFAQRLGESNCLQHRAPAKRIASANGLYAFKCRKLFQVSTSGERPVAYAAIGYEKEHIFYPARTITKPKLPLKLPLPNGVDRPVVQLVNAFGDQAFFTVD